MILIRKAKNFCKSSFQRQYLLLGAFFLSIYTLVLFRFFYKYARFGKEIKITKIESHIQLSSSKTAKIQDIAWAIFVVNKYLPWENLCRHQAFQAKILCALYKIPCQIYVGFKKGNETGKIDGHAWTIANKQMITGLCKPEEYTMQQIFENA